jgi:hypothetical protein
MGGAQGVVERKRLGERDRVGAAAREENRRRQPARVGGVAPKLPVEKPASADTRTPASADATATPPPSDQPTSSTRRCEPPGSARRCTAASATVRSQNGNALANAACAPQ